MRQIEADALSTLIRSANARPGDLGSMLGALALVEEFTDGETSRHQARVAVLADRIGRALRLPAAQQEAVTLGALIHDVGKAALHSAILRKPYRLTGAEMRHIRSHPLLGFEMLRALDVEWPVSRIILEHHERLDGSGYPQGLSGDEISLEARVVAVADVVDSMLSHRPYRRGLALPAALAELGRFRGRKYDSLVADACIDLFHAGYAIPA